MIQYGLQHLSRFIQMIQNVLNELQCGYLLQLGSLHGLLRNSCSTMVSFMDSKRFSASARGASSYSLTLVLWNCLSQFFSSTLTAWAPFCFFLNVFFLRWQQHSCWSQLWPEMGMLVWNQLCLSQGNPWCLLVRPPLETLLPMPWIYSRYKYFRVWLQ